MAQLELVFINPMGGVQVKANSTYSSNNIPPEAKIVSLTRGVRILDDLGTPTPLRGVRVLITTVGLTEPSNPLSNVPIVWVEGQSLVFTVGFTYTFLDDGIVVYGTKATV
jgi:hypothetical protein